MFGDIPCPALTEDELKILYSILSQIKSNMKKHENGSHALSECSFVFNTDYGIHSTFNNLFRKFDKAIAEAPQ